jgi:hypothetical protein
MKYYFNPKINRPISRNLPGLRMSGRPVSAKKAKSFTVDPFNRMVKLTDLSPNMNLGPYKEKVLALRKECFEYMPVLENYMIKLRGDAQDSNYIQMAANGMKDGPCVRNEKRVRLDSDLEKSFFLFSLMDEILKRITCAINYYDKNKKAGRSDIHPFVLFGFEKFRPEETFVKLEPYTERFFGQGDDIGRSFMEAYVIQIPDKVTKNFDLYFPTTDQDAKHFGFSTRITDKRYVGLFDQASKKAYMMQRLGLIAHYNLHLFARTILSFISHQPECNNK